MKSTITNHTTLVTMMIILTASALIAAIYPSISSQASVKSLRTTGTLSQMIDKEIYKIEAEQDLQTYEAYNAAQRLRASFTPNGVTLEPVAGKGHAWHWGMKLIGYGYGNRIEALGPGKLTVVGNRIENQHPSAQDSAGPSEWYINGSDGIEQGFTINARPQTARAGEVLRLVMSLSGTLTATIDQSSQALILRNTTGEEMLRYHKLAVFDANGAHLEASLALDDNRLSVLVDDAGAAYPLTVDPVFQSPVRLNTDDVDSNDGFGYSISISGATAVVGAPFKNGDRGAAYVFVSNENNDWWLLDKLTAGDDSSDGDHFGFSVAVSGDNIVVGAPDDNQEGCYYHPTRCTPNASVDAGSVHIFRRSNGHFNRTNSFQFPGDDPWSHNKVQFGYSVAISGDLVAIGAPGKSNHTVRIEDNDNTGAVVTKNVCEPDSVGWTVFTAPDNQPRDRFGESVAIDGDQVLAGAPGKDNGSGAAYAMVHYDRVQRLWADDGYGGFGKSVSVSGKYALVGAPNWHGDQGATFIFSKTDDQWSEMLRLDGEGGYYHFGKAVAISGNVAVATGVKAESGSQQDTGTLYVYSLIRDAGWTLKDRLARNNERWFGSSLAIDGTRIAAGGFGNDEGAALIYKAVAPLLTVTADTINLPRDGRVSGYKIGTTTSLQDPTTLKVEVSTNLPQYVYQADATIDPLGSFPPWLRETGSLKANILLTSCLGSTTNYNFHVTITDQGGSKVEHDFAINITPETSPVVVEQPKDVTLCEGAGVATFTSTVERSIEYPLWQVSTDGGATYTDILDTNMNYDDPNVIRTTYSVPASAKLNGYKYRVKYKRCSETSYSNPATLTVNPLPAVTSNPQTQTANVNDRVMFTAASNVNNASVQWQVSGDEGKNFADIPGATNPTYSFLVIGTENGREYRAIFTTACGSVASNSAGLTVKNSANLHVNAVFSTAASPGKELRYQINIYNDGPSAARDVVFSSPVMGNITFVSASVLSDSFEWKLITPAAGATGNVLFAKDWLPVGKKVVLEIVAKVDEKTPLNTVISTVVRTSTTTPDPDPSENLVTITTTVQPILQPPVRGPIKR